MWAQTTLSETITNTRQDKIHTIKVYSTSLLSFNYQGKVTTISSQFLDLKSFSKIVSLWSIKRAFLKNNSSFDINNVTLP